MAYPIPEKNMDKTGQSMLSSLHPESLKLICDRQPFPQKQGTGWSIDGQVFTDYDLFVCRGGQAEFSVEGRSWLLSEKQAFLAPRGKAIYARLAGNNQFEAVAQHFELKLFGEEDFFSLVRYKPLVRFSGWEWISSLLDRLTLLACDDNSKIQRHALFNLILMEFLVESCIGFRENRNPVNQIILEMLSEIDEHFDDDRVIEKAMERSPYSQDYTSRLFRKKMGRPPRQYLIYKRLQKSKDLLMQSRSVKEAAFGAGFRDELYFSRLFKKHEGCAPSEYRVRRM
jgi:AraC family transcriptional regulator